MNSFWTFWICLLALFSVSSAFAASDDFEGYAPGVFPSPGWSDIGLVEPDPPNPPNPSAVVAQATGPLGAPTQVLSLVDALAPSQGIYRSIPVGEQYHVAVEARVDRFCNASQDTVFDWAIEAAVGHFVPGIDPCCGPQCGIYASSFTRGWRLYVSGTKSGFLTDIDLGLAVQLGRWYGLKLDLDAVAGLVRSQVLDAATGAVLIDRTDVIKNWSDGNGLFDVVNFFDGELSPGNTVGNLAVIDNVQFSVEATGLLAEAPPPPPAGLRVYPNPVPRAAVIEWMSSAETSAALRLYGPTGRLLRARALGAGVAGPMTVPWSELVGGGALPSGVYFLELELTPGGKQTTAISVTR